MSLITLPFTFNLYGQPFTNANVSSNGNVQFVSNLPVCCDQPQCLPNAGFDYTIFAYYVDLYTTNVANGQGIFTSVSGTSPNRVFNIEWRADYCCDPSSSPAVNFEVRLYEGQTRFDLIYGNIASNTDIRLIGVQKDIGSQFTIYSCHNSNPASGVLLDFDLCVPPTPTY